MLEDLDVETSLTVIENIQQSTPQEVLAAGSVKEIKPVKDSIFLILGAVLIIVALNFAAFHASLRGYFLADDFAHVDYLKSVFNGNAHLLVKNFYSNWMQTLGTSFYRPFISITLASDYLFWGANPNGFHLSNFLYQTLSSVFLFLALNFMFPALDARARFSTAFLTAALFACHPLHPEVASWIIARVDSVCTTFLFLSLWLYLLSRQSMARQAQAFQILSLASFALSLMSKEMAITLPPTIFLYELVNASAMTKSGGLPARIFSALRASQWHIGMLIFYLGFRAISLGTLFGGYGGSVGEGLQATLWRRWFEEGCLLRLLLPFNELVTEPKDKLRLVFKLMTAGAAAIAMVRALSAMRKNGFKALPSTLSPFLIFGLGWFAIALAPTIQVFDITTTLQGGRFVYLATAPVVLVIAALIFGAGDEKKSHGHISLMAILSMALAALFIASYTLLANANNQPWREASRGVSNLREGVENALAGQPPEMKVVVLNLPPQHKGAHMLYNAAMFGVALKPPLSKEDISERIITFEPVTFGDANLIARTRLRSLLRNKNVASVLVWDDAAQKLLPMKNWRDNGQAKPAETFELAGAESTLENQNQFFQSPIIDVPSTDFDFLDLTLKVEPKNAREPAANAILLLSWVGATHPIYSSQRQIALPIKSKQDTYRFSVGELKSWVAEGRIRGLRIDTSEKPCKITVKRATFINADNLIPDLSIAPECKFHIDSNGTLYTNRNLGPLNYDASRIEGAKSVRYEISKPESWFEHYSGTLRDKAPSDRTSDAGKLPQLSAQNAFIPLNALTIPGFYEFRILALDAQDKPLGYASNPINFQLNASYFKGTKTQAGGRLDRK
ncbi:MAG TPA: hypothetical protein PKZ32_09790 [Candidatus Melainabacteria bacterium]|nr:hypothetical protein [Candidatus Melainabacteria bacterium]